MKRFSSIIGILMFALQGLTQVPQGFNYQAVIRNSEGEAFANKSLTLQIGIRQETAIGPMVYEESHTKTSSSFGLVDVVVGKGTSTGNGSGNFDAIPWLEEDFFLELKVDTGTGFLALGTMQLLSVPYALAANKADSASKATNMILNDLTNVFVNDVALNDVLKWDGEKWVAGKDDQLTLPFADTISLSYGEALRIINSSNATGSKAAVFKVGDASGVGHGGSAAITALGGEGGYGVYAEGALAGVYAKSTGFGGAAIQAEASGSATGISSTASGGGSALSAVVPSNGLGSAAEFRILNSSNTSAALFATTFGTGYAAEFIGDVQVDGKLSNYNSGGANLLPLAMATVRSLGSEVNGFNMSVTRLGAGEYQISIPNETISEMEHVVIVTPLTNGKLTSTWDTLSGNLYVYTSNGGNANIDSDFSIIVYKP